MLNGNDHPSSLCAPIVIVKTFLHSNKQNFLRSFKCYVGANMNIISMQNYNNPNSTLCRWTFPWSKAIFCIGRYFYCKIHYTITAHNIWLFKLHKYWIKCVWLWQLVWRSFILPMALRMPLILILLVVANAYSPSPHPCHSVKVSYQNGDDINFTFSRLAVRVQTFIVVFCILACKRNSY